MNSEQLKRVANARYVALRRKDETIEELRKGLEQEVLDSTRLMETVTRYARDLTERDEEIVRLKNEIFALRVQLYAQVYEHEPKTQKGGIE